MLSEVLKASLNDPTYLNHKLGDKYSMFNVGGKSDSKVWKIAYYPLFGDWKAGEWVEFDEPRALIEANMGNDGTDFRTVPLRYLIKIQ